jgi:hypothetical protein
MQKSKLRTDLLRAFTSVEKVPFKPFEPDHWRKSRPTSFNCSSFVQWLALRCLGWSEAERTDPRLDLPSATNFAYAHHDLFDDVKGDTEPGDVCVYVDAGDASACHCMISLGTDLADEAIGACESAGRLVRRPALYDARWTLLRARRIRRGSAR